MPRLVVVSNRLPVTLKCTNEGGSVKQASIEDFRGFFHRKTDESVVPSPEAEILDADATTTTASVATPLSPSVRSRASSRESLSAVAAPDTPSSAAAAAAAILNCGSGNANANANANLDGDIAGLTDTTAAAAAAAGDKKKEPSSESDTHSEWTFTVSSGGLVSALTGLKNKGVTFDWVGWPGTDVPPRDQAHIRELIAPSNATPIFLTDREADLHYNGFSNSVMWPLLHYQTPEMHHVYDSYEGYKVANEKFADAIEAMAQESDLVWVHDYHLMLLPKMLRDRMMRRGRRGGMPRVRVGFFLHTSFPSSDVFRTLPMRRELLRGVLGADYVGFHTHDYARHFLSACQRILGLETVGGTGVRVGMRVVRVAVHPIGIEPEKFFAALGSPPVEKRLAEFRESFAGRKVIVGVDRMDYIKGIPQKLLAFERFLRDNPDARGGKVTLVQICVPSRQDVPEYQDLAAQVDRFVGRLNGVYGTITGCPVHYLHMSIPFETLVALYAVADACLITSLRDGMNLVSYEYVASQRDNAGVLILSEFAGAAQSFDGAVIVNPYNVEMVAKAIKDALDATPQKRKEQHAKLLQYVSDHTAATWGMAFVSELERSADWAAVAVPELDTAQCVSAFLNAAPGTERVIVIDLDGVITRFKLDATKRPSEEVTKTVTALSRLASTSVYVLSGRSRSQLLSWFSAHPSIGLVAEHGLFVRHPAREGDGNGANTTWHLSGSIQNNYAAPGTPQSTTTSPRGETSSSNSGDATTGIPTSSTDQPANPTTPKPATTSTGTKATTATSHKLPPLPDTDLLTEPHWFTRALPVLHYYTERTPGSRVDVKEATLTWHYRGADPEFGSWQAPRVKAALEAALGRDNVEVAMGSRALEVRPGGEGRCGAVALIAEEVMGCVKGEWMARKGASGGGGSSASSVASSPLPAASADPAPTSSSSSSSSTSSSAPSASGGLTGGSGKHRPIGFALGIGDSLSVTDGVYEAMPKVFFGQERSPQCFTCTVAASDDTMVGYFIRDQDSVLALLDEIVAAAEGRTVTPGAPAARDTDAE